LDADSDDSDNTSDNAAQRINIPKLAIAQHGGVSGPINEEQPSAANDDNSPKSKEKKKKKKVSTFRLIKFPLF
jgi:hypothetical protein